MIVTIFRSRLNEGIQDDYDAHVDSTAALVESAPGFASHKLFVAEDGERITVVEFESLEAQRAWSLSREHVEAAKAGRRRFYSEYRIQVCSVIRESSFSAETAPVPLT